MATPKDDLLTAGKLAEKLGAPGAQVKKAIETLRIKPVAVKGGCKYYGPEAVAKVKAALK